MKHVEFVLLSLFISSQIACFDDTPNPLDAGSQDSRCAPDAEPHDDDAATCSEATCSQPQPAREAILAAFDHYRIVGGMSAGHGNKEVDDFILDLIRHPSFPEKANDIVVECGNSFYQALLDRYISGEDVPFAEVRRVWRDTPEIQCGFSTFYERLFPLVRRINNRLPADKKLRVLAGDAPVEWSTVDGPAEWDTDATTIEVVLKEVLQRGRKALMLFGIYHMMHGPDSPVDSAVALYEQQGYPGITYVIADHIGFGNQMELPKDNDELEARMASWPVPALINIKGSWLAQLDAAYFNTEPAFPGQRGFPGIDGYLYVGPRDLLLSEPLSAQAMLDRDYLAELDQRADTLGTPPSAPSRTQTILDRAATASPFSFGEP